MRKIVVGLAGISAALFLTGAASAGCAFHNQQVMASAAPVKETVAMSTHDEATPATRPAEEKTAAAEKTCIGKDSCPEAGTK
ncbi:hypothetical protein [Afifella sp. IM 167]|uniref:hypothetical protein n=1 Tax=Afifella sp. IM 167 TaxID=2033586 RepID=UPI001CCB7EC3|nr:hypothetical protein [Afifella sp. IM 167]MBZ8135012.1 hypothetical protein [Afifella sp. IM 167]